MMGICQRCGKCCKDERCLLSVEFVLGTDNICPALEPDGNGLYQCGLVKHPTKYINVGANRGWKDDMLAEIFGRLLGIGRGCDASL